MEKHIVEAAETRERLDAWLVAKHPELSRSQLAKLIKVGKILVNGQVVKSHHFLKNDDVVEILSLAAIEAMAMDKPVIDLRDQIEVIKDTDDYVVINKPAGMIVHYPVEKVGVELAPRSLSVVDWALEHYPQVRQVGDDPSRPGIVHRLDKAVSGLMVIAKTHTSFEDLKRQFKERSVKKSYQALAYNVTVKDQDVLTFPIMRSTSGHKMAANPFGGPGKPSITELTVNRRFVNYTFLDINLKTGRTHQIRCHLAAYGQPIVGDNVYGTATTKKKNRKLKLNRVFLVSVALLFKDLQGEEQFFRIDLPEDLEKILNTVK